MDYFGINNASELPKINEVLMEELVKATVVAPDEEGHQTTNIIENNSDELNEMKPDSLPLENENSTEENNQDN